MLLHISEKAHMQTLKRGSGAGAGRSGVGVVAGRGGGGGIGGEGVKFYINSMSSEKYMNLK